MQFLLLKFFELNVQNLFPKITFYKNDLLKFSAKLRITMLQLNAFLHQITDCNTYSYHEKGAAPSANIRGSTDENPY